MIFYQNRYYLLVYAFFALSLVVYQFNFEQTEAIFFFSDHRNIVLNTFFAFITRLGEELVYVLLVLYAFLWLKDKVLSLHITLIGTVVLIVSSLMKVIFQHPRPLRVITEAHQFATFHLIEGVEQLSGYNSFPSGHTTSAFALYGFFAFTMCQKTWQQLALLALAILVGLSRIYLAAHFPEDVLFGSVLGTSIALTLSSLLRK